MIEVVSVDGEIPGYQCFTVRLPEFMRPRDGEDWAAGSWFHATFEHEDRTWRIEGAGGTGQVDYDRFHVACVAV